MTLYTPLEDKYRASLSCGLHDELGTRLCGTISPKNSATSIELISLSKRRTDGSYHAPSSLHSQSVVQA